MRPSFPSLIALIADKVDLVDLDLRPFRHMERDVDELGPALDVLDLGPDFGELIPLRCIELADDAGDASNEPRIDERVEPDRDALLFHASSIFDWSTFFRPS